MIRQTDRIALMVNTKAQCPCGLPEPYNVCCGVFHKRSASPKTAEQLMRSRYSAFALSEFGYLLDTSPVVDRDAALAQLEKSNVGCKWLSLEVIDSVDGAGTVEFVARYFQSGTVHSMRERSQFEKKNGCWLYINGEMMASDEPIIQSMNAVCFCSSGKKFKRCHGK